MRVYRGRCRVCRALLREGRGCSREHVRLPANGKKKAVKRALRMSRDEALWLEKYPDGATFAEIGKELGMSRQAVWETFQRAMRKLGGVVGN